MGSCARLIAVEGIDGSGKSTQAGLLADSLGATLTFEPGATELGASLRTLLLDTQTTITPLTEALLMIADRAQHVEEIVRPTLDRGTWVVTDRFSGSTLAYQGAGRGLARSLLDNLIELATSGLRPDLTLLLDVPTTLARKRLERSKSDRLERLDASFHDRVRDGFLAEARRHRESWVVVDADRPVEVVASELTKIVKSRFATTNSGCDE